MATEPQLPELYLGGLGISLNSTHPDHQIDIAEGCCRCSTDCDDIVSDATITVDIEDVGVNGLDEGAAAASTLYYVWIIHDIDTCTVAGLLSLSDSAPTMPAGYTYKRLIGNVMNNDSSDFENPRAAGCVQQKLTWIQKTGAYTASNLDGILLDSTGGAFTITLPANPVGGEMVGFIDAGSDCGTNNVTVGRNGENIQGIAEDLLVDFDGAAFTLIFDPSYGWRLEAFYGDGYTILDEDDMASDSASALATQQSIKAYTDMIDGKTRKNAFSATKSVSQTTAAGVIEILELDTEQYDYAGTYDHTTYRFTPDEAGIYLFCFNASSSATGIINILLKKNGVYIYNSNQAGTTATGGAQGADMVYMNGSTDYIEFWIRTFTIETIYGDDSAVGLTKWTATLIAGED